MALKIALTGGIAAGKSALARGFTERGITVVEADRIAHALLEINTPSYHTIVAHFSKNILNPDLTVNRTILREIIFNNPSQKIWLEQTLHPLIKEQLLNTLNAVQGPYAIAVIPLLVETGWQRLFDYVVTVEANADIRLKRLIQRDQISANLAKQMIQQQATPEARAAIAHTVITLNTFDKLDDILFSLDQQWRQLIK